MIRGRASLIWAGLAALAAVYLVVLALHGGRPEAGLDRFVAAGPMTTPLPAQVEDVLIVRGEQRWRFRRRDAVRWTQEEGAVAAAGFEAAIEQGLHLLHSTAIERRMSREELAGAERAVFGLDAQALAVTARGAGQSFEIAFGALNPLGLACYARIGNGEEVVLLPSYVAASWQQAIGGSR